MEERFFKFAEAVDEKRKGRRRSPDTENGLCPIPEPPTDISDNKKTNPKEYNSMSTFLDESDTQR